MAPSPSPRPSSFQTPTNNGRIDTLATFYQILSVQMLHYLTLCVLIPPLLSLLPTTSSVSLNFEGGPAQIGMILDWRELSSRRTFDWSPLQGGFLDWRKGLSKEVLMSGLDDGDKAAARVWTAGSVWLGDVSDSGGDALSSPPPVVIPSPRIIRPHERFPKQQDGGESPGAAANTAADADAIADATSSSPTGGSQAETDLEQWEWSITRDPTRGWAIAIAWVAACAVDVFLLTTVVRRPKHILDHVATLHLVHLLLTSWYSSSIPTSLFWWMVMVAHGAACIVWAEREAVKREMNVQVGWGLVGSGREDVEHGAGDGDVSGDGNGGIPLSVIRAPTAAASQPAPHVLFDEEEEDGDDGNDDESARLVGKAVDPAAPHMDKSTPSFAKSNGKA